MNTATKATMYLNAGEGPGNRDVRSATSGGRCPPGHPGRPDFREGDRHPCRPGIRCCSRSGGTTRGRIWCETGECAAMTDADLVEHVVASWGHRLGRRREDEDEAA